MTNNAEVIPNTLATAVVTVDPLSIEESAKLIGRLAGHKLSKEEEKLLETTADKRGWRYIPLVMAW